MVETMHGRVPVPAPATLEILRDLPVRFEGQGELTTPTGAALLRALTRPGPPPPLRVQRTGYGLGRREIQDRPNVLRATLGIAVETAAADVWELAVTLDDATPQLLGYLVETLLSHGALDAWVAPVTLKKSRPGHVLSVLVAGADREHVVRRLLSESPTLGVRAWPVQRTVLDRAHVEVETAHGPVRVKIGSLDGETLNAAPEYEDVRARAEASGVPFKQVWAEALAAYARRR
jgi:uncharacterized protein (TIGR00299 family) protein